MKFITQNMDEYTQFNTKINITMDVYLASSLEDYIAAIKACKLYIGELSAPLTYAYGLHKKHIVLRNGDCNVFIDGLDKILPVAY